MIFALEARLGLNTTIVFIQKLFLKNQNIFNLGYNFYLLKTTENQKKSKF